MDGTDENAASSLDLDALAVSDRFRLFNFTRRDDHIAYLWVLRALERLRAVHQVQAHTEDVVGSGGYADNEALVAELLGFRPTRHAPLGTESTLRFAGVGPGVGPDPDPDADADPDDEAQ